MAISLGISRMLQFSRLSTVRRLLCNSTNAPSLSYSNRFIHKEVEHASQTDSKGLPFDSKLKVYLNKVKLKRDSLLCGNTSDLEQQKEIRFLQPLANLAEKLFQVENDLSELDVMIQNESDEDLKKMVDAERAKLFETCTTIQNQVLSIILPEENTQMEGIIVEISAGVGGQEAMLFCNDLLQMYTNYCENQGWDHTLAEHENSDLDGIRHAALSIDHPEAYHHLKFEGGVHRVQRIPKTEKAGRIHTSTVAVAILPQPSEVTVKIDPKDLKVETKRASGAGGQHVNTTDSAVRLTHLPTGLVVECQTQRSQIKNREAALSKLRARLYQAQLEKQLSSTRSSRKLQVGSSARSEKIRTYNFPQDRVTDHRINFTTHNLDEFLSGSRPLETMLHKLDEESQKEQLAEFLENEGIK